MNAAFTVIEPLPLPVTLPGPWQPQAIGSAFTSGELPDVIWQARLPDDLATAQAALHTAQVHLVAHEVALAQVEPRLRQVLNGAVSFSEKMPQADQVLLSMLLSTPA